MNEQDIFTFSNVKGTLRIRFWYKGERLSLSPGVKFEKLPELDKLLLTLKLDIENLCVDTSLKKYKLRKPKEIKIIKPKPIPELFKQWVTLYKGGSVEKSGYGAIYNMILKWEEIPIEKYPELLGKQPLCPSTYNRRKNSLSKFFDWAVFKKHISSNPLLFVDSKKSNKKKKSERLPLSNSDILKFLKAIKEDTYSSKYSPTPHSYYYPLLYFMFRTGVRNQEAFGLKVKYVDFKKSIITIVEVVARKDYSGSRYNIFKETKTGNQRVIPITEDLVALLQEQCNMKDPEDLVFPSPQKKIIDSKNFQKRIFKPVLQQLGISDRDLYVARHSFSTRSLQSGVSVLDTAYLMGNSPRTIYLHYASLINKPDFLPDLGWFIPLKCCDSSSLRIFFVQKYYFCNTLVHYEE